MSAFVVSRAWCSLATRARRSAHGVGPLSSVAVHLAVGLLRLRTQLVTAMLLGWARPCHGSIASRAMEGARRAKPSPRCMATRPAAPPSSLPSPPQRWAGQRASAPLSIGALTPLARWSVTARAQATEKVFHHHLDQSQHRTGWSRWRGMAEGRAQEIRAGSQLDAAAAICVREVRTPHLLQARCVASQAGQPGPSTWLPSAIAERGGAYAGAWVRIRKHFLARRRGAAGAGGCVFVSCVRPWARHIMLGMWRWRPAQDPCLSWADRCGPHRAIRPEAHGSCPMRRVSTPPRLASRLRWPLPHSAARSRPRGDDGRPHDLPSQSQNGRCRGRAAISRWFLSQLAHPRGRAQLAALTAHAQPRPIVHSARARREPRTDGHWRICRR